MDKLNHQRIRWGYDPRTKQSFPCRIVDWPKCLIRDLRMGKVRNAHQERLWVMAAGNQPPQPVALSHG